MSYDISMKSKIVPYFGSIFIKIVLISGSIVKKLTFSYDKCDSMEDASFDIRDIFNFIL